MGKASGSNAVEVPDFRGMSETEARETAAQLSLTIEVVYEESDKSAGTVIGQSLIPQTSVTPNTQISLTVSGGTSFVEKSVPNITGLTGRQAEAELAKVGLKLGTRTEAPSDLEEGRIIEQSPAPGTPI